MSKDYTKLQKFVEAAISNPLHPVYKMGLQHSPMLQSYAVNVNMLQSMKPEQWFTDYPEKTAKLEEVMKLCEEEEGKAAQADEQLTALAKRVEELEAKLKKSEDKPAEETTPETAETPEA